MKCQKKSIKKLLKNQYMREYRAKNSESLKKYRKENYFKYKEKADRYKKQWYQKNKEKIKQKRKNYYLKNKEIILKQQKEYNLKNKEEKRKYIRNYNVLRRKKDINFKILNVLRSRLNKVINKKINNALELTGCSIEFLINHLQSQFKENMSWENYGRKGWHIDHIKPCASFNLTNLEEQKECFHYSNLQPLWWWENASKGCKL